MKKIKPSEALEKYFETRLIRWHLICRWIDKHCTLNDEGTPTLDKIERMARRIK